MKLFRSFILFTFTLLTSLGAGAETAAAGVCEGNMFNPASDPDWGNAFPITIMGVSIGKNSNPPLMRMPPVCVCPGIFGYPSPGIGITYWQPRLIAEIEKSAGCSASFGGKKLFSGYDALNSEQGYFDPDKGAATATRMQMHVYEYPLFALLDIFKSGLCRSSSGFDLVYASEIDPTWQNDLWAGIFNPEAGLFANLVAQTACTVDSVAANLAFPLDPLFWCAGSWGGIYPMSGTANQSMYTFQLNHLVLAKYLARMARLGLAFTTIGPTAICAAHPNPIWVKSQYRVDQVYPISRHGSPLVIGAMPIKQVPFMITNTPGRESTVDLIWQGQQCCVRF